MGDNNGQNQGLNTQDMFNELDQIVKRMDAGNQPLENAFADYRRGMELVRMLDTSLTGMEKQLEILNKSTGELEAANGFAEAGFDETGEEYQDEYKLPFN